MLARKKFTKKVYIKDTSNDPFFKTYNKEFFLKTRVIPGIFTALGFVILGTQVVLPLALYENDPKITKPMEESVLGKATGFAEFEFSELEEEQIPIDSLADNSELPQKEVLPDYFYITIPKLGIKKAKVETNSTDLSPTKSLGHYKGSAFPGDNGNAFVYGHSVLPIFYNPNNYKTIFSTLDNLEDGDEFYVEYNNKKLTYRVETKKTLEPEEIDPLEEIKPKYLNESTMVLMTCWPAGTKSKRLMVNSVLVD